MIILAVFLLSTGAHAAGEKFILLEKDGLVSVFDETNLENPALRTDIAVRFLPASDQNQLKEGIRVEGRDALLCILEDLGS